MGLGVQMPGFSLCSGKAVEARLGWEESSHLGFLFALRREWDWLGLE